MYSFEHVDSRCSQVSVWLFWRTVQFGFGCVIHPKFIFSVTAHVLVIVKL